MALTKVTSSLTDLDGGITIDNITIDGTTMTLSSGSMTIDVADNIVFDTDGGNIALKDNGTQWGNFANNGGDFEIDSLVQDKDIKFNGYDGSSYITAGFFDMSDGGKLQIGASTVANLNMGRNGDVIEIKAKKDGTDDIDLAFLTQASGGTTGERMRIVSTGQIGVGITAPTSNGGANGGLIHIHGGSADWSILHCTTPSSGSAAADGVLLGMITETVYLFSYQAADILFGVGGQTKAKIDGSNGDFFTNDGSVSSLSDKRIKKNITPLAEGLDLVKKLNPVNFEYCNTYEGQREDGLGVDDGRIHKGFIADEVQEVAPSYVEETNGIVLNEEVDDLKTLSMTTMIPMLVKAIQELSAKVEELESKIDG